jgi:hypothetical protein
MRHAERYTQPPYNDGLCAKHIKIDVGSKLLHSRKQENSVNTPNSNYVYDDLLFGKIGSIKEINTI